LIGDGNVVMVESDGAVAGPELAIAIALASSGNTDWKGEYLIHPVIL